MSLDLTAIMTSNSAPAPNVCAASTEFSADYAAWKAFDKDTATYWATTTAGVAPCWISFSWGAGNNWVANRYTIRARSDAADGAPKNWTFDGYNGESWTTLHTVANQTGWSNGELRSFDFGNETGYEAYRLSISANNGRTTTNIAEIQIVDVPRLPTDGQTWVSRTPTLQWRPVPGATSYDIYLGTNQALVAAGDQSVFKGNQAGLTYSPAQLDENTVYYWRIDAKNGGTTQGDVWSFKTGWTYNYQNANNFANDPNCVALWRFESGALTTDSSGNGNTLSLAAVPPASADTVNFKEGAASIDFECDSNQWAWRSDSNLSSNFPLKSNYASAVQISFCCWFRLESLPDGTTTYWRTVFGKWEQITGVDARSMALSIYRASGSPDAARLLLQKGYNTGLNNEFTILPTVLVAGRWYHVTVTYDDTTKAVRIRLWDDTAQDITEITATHGQGISLVDESFKLACRQSLFAQAYMYDGLLDEAIVFNDILTVAEIDAVRTGTYPTGLQPPVTGNPWWLYAIQRRQ